jgi:hypothetical protein
MIWATREVVNLLDVKSEFGDGQVSHSAARFRPEEEYSMAQIIFPTDAVRVTMVPYKIEALLGSLERKFDGYTIHKLCAGIRDETKVVHLGWWYTPEGGDYRTEYYFFKDDQPSKYNLEGSHGIIRSLGGPWPLEKPRIIDAEVRLYFNDLMKIRPEASESIAACVELLA